MEPRYRKPGQSLLGEPSEEPVAPPSPDYVPGPEHPASPDYVPGPEHPPSPIEITYVNEPEIKRRTPRRCMLINLLTEGDGDDEPSDDDNDVADAGTEECQTEATDRPPWWLALLSMLHAPNTTIHPVCTSPHFNTFHLLHPGLIFPRLICRLGRELVLLLPLPDMRSGRVQRGASKDSLGFTPAVDNLGDQIVEAMMEIAPTTLEGVDQRVTELDTTVRQRTEEFETRFEEAHDDRAYLGASQHTLQKRDYQHARTSVGYNAVGPPTEHLGRIATIEARDQNVTQQEEATEDNTCHRNHFIPPCYLRTQLQAINCSGDAAASSSTRCQEEQAMANNKTWFTGKRRRRSRGPEHNHGPRNDWNMFSLSATVLLKVQGRDQKARESEYWTPEGVKGVTCPPKAEEWISRESGAGYGNAVEELMCGVGTAETNPNSNVVTGTFLLNNRYASILFDTSADRSFVSTAFSSLIDIIPATLDNGYDVELADGRIIWVNTLIWGGTLNFLNHPFNIDLMPVEMGSFDVIIGLD
ncbi:hypothetical protein Tco_1191366 [Tanacetum coccineum]